MSLGPCFAVGWKDIDYRLKRDHLTRCQTQKKSKELRAKLHAVRGRQYDSKLKSKEKKLRLDRRV